jgi:hypothetical protein
MLHVQEWNTPLNFEAGNSLIPMKYNYLYTVILVSFLVACHII